MSVSIIKIFVCVLMHILNMLVHIDIFLYFFKGIKQKQASLLIEACEVVATQYKDMMRR